MIFTNEHKSYNDLSKLGFINKTACHKYNFVNPITGAHTQFIESFNNELKLEIKRRKGIYTQNKEDFLVEFVWKFNNKINMLQKILLLIKV
ncbi:hypothetical protein H312_01962 [Anncaliia algerae PRA339]|uniref:ISXO2-like transposase domain-containing protein n=1 Tax=Anncaliia algerae PRA339 TaxID=1288291 RepID=A0A059F0Z9_9MICR|nr:hypothetical protein H312_01962 [Anncaliia algerae PRA339]